MATLNLFIPTTGEEFGVADIDFAVVTPKDILSSDDLGLPASPVGDEWEMLKGTNVVDSNTTLEKLGFKDGDKADVILRYRHSA